MRIALDAMGGDFAPSPNIVGAFEAVERNQKLEILLVGDRACLEEEIAKVDAYLSKRWPAGESIFVIPSQYRIQLLAWKQALEKNMA